MPFADDAIEVLDKVLFASFILCRDFVFLIGVEDGTVIFVLALLSDIVGIDTSLFGYR